MSLKFGCKFTSNQNKKETQSVANIMMPIKWKLKQMQEMPAISGSEIPVTYNSWFPRRATDAIIANILSLPTFSKIGKFLSIPPAHASDMLV